MNGYQPRKGKMPPPPMNAQFHIAGDGVHPPITVNCRCCWPPRFLRPAQLPWEPWRFVMDDGTAKMMVGPDGLYACFATITILHAMRKS